MQKKIRNCPFADDVLYDIEQNVWARLTVEDGREVAVVGVDTILAWLSGALTSVSFKQARGSIVERGKSLGFTEGPRHFDAIRSPLTGELLEVNEQLEHDPKLINRDPFGDGWVAKLRPTKLEIERGRLLSFAAAAGGLEKKIIDLNVRCFAEFPDYDMYEIGSECSGVLVKLDDLVARSPKGTVVHLVSDDVTAEIELIGWSDRTHQELVETQREGNLFHFIVKKVVDDARVERASPGEQQTQQNKTVR